MIVGLRTRGRAGKQEGHGNSLHGRHREMSRSSGQYKDRYVSFCLSMIFVSSSAVIHWPAVMTPIGRSRASRESSGLPSIRTGRDDRLFGPDLPYPAQVENDGASHLQDRGHAICRVQHEIVRILHMRMHVGETG
jgi:hypothetical protein